MTVNKLVETYLDRGWALVPLAPGEKRPTQPAWNRPENLITTRQKAATAFADPKVNIGVHLAQSGLCSLDLDVLDDAVIALAAAGIDAKAMIAAGWQVISGKPNKGHTLFTAPPGLIISHKKFRVPLPRSEWPDGKPRFRVIFELRGGSANLQDVLAPSIHPDTKAPYTAALPPAKLPALPAALATLWLNWTARVPLMLAALGVDPALNSLCSTDDDLKTLRHSAACRAAYNAAHTVESLLLAHGYTQVGERWSHAGASGGPGVRKIPKRDDLWQSDNFGDPLCGTFDAWTAHVILDHLGDVDAAVNTHVHGRIAEAQHVFKTTGLTIASTEPAPAMPKLNGVAVTLATVAEKTLAPREWIFHDLMTYGAALLVGRPKVGKSWLVLEWLINAAHGKPFLGWRCTAPVGSLYFAAEDDEHRIQERLKHLGVTSPPSTVALVLQDGLRQLAQQYNDQFDTFHEFLAYYLPNHHPNAKIVVLDTPATIEAMWAGEQISEKQRATQTKLDYRASRVYDQVGLAQHISILLLHHTAKRKAGARVTDYHEMINTTNTTLAGASASFVMADTPDYDPMGPKMDTKVLAIRGRDIAHDGLYLLRQDAHAWFENEGEYHLTQNTEREQVILHALESMSKDDGWSGAHFTAGEIAKYLGDKKVTIERTVTRMKKGGRMQYNEYAIEHARGPGGGLRLVPRARAIFDPVLSDPLFS